MDLGSRKCQPCSGDSAALSSAGIQRLQKEIDHHWEVVDAHHLQRRFLFPSFQRALGFVNRIGELSEKEGHHPEIHLRHNEVFLRVWTHVLDALSENDFILAAKIERLIQHEGS